ncbi:DUF1045 domain-containing protein [Rhodobacteraceae bacterium D3-12]|nr:DUF1045 domain-containing protein [Rhodobacteraceae bacterium D3-12]
MGHTAEFRRFAVYFTPPPGPLADLGAAWLGWDAAHARAVPHPSLPALPLPVEKITAVPRKYGFHATLKPPFALAATTSLDALKSDLADLAARLAPVTLEALNVTRLGSFLALVPAGDTSALSALAATLVRELDHHRAPLLDADLAKRRANGLSAAQDANLLQWGYPYVMQEFRFHMTLTGRLPKSQAQTIAQALSPLFHPHLPSPFPIDAISLSGEDQNGRFHTLSRYTLGG